MAGVRFVVDGKTFLIHEGVSYKKGLPEDVEFTDLDTGSIHIRKASRLYSLMEEGRLTYAGFDGRGWRSTFDKR